MPAPTRPAANVTEEAAAAIVRRLAQYKGRADIEVLAVTAVAPAVLYGSWGHAQGLELTVDFTYTTGRRQRRTAQVRWALFDKCGVLDSYPGVPDAVWALLNDALEIASLLPATPTP